MDGGKEEREMKNYIKRLNWSGFFVMFFLMGAAAFSREQDPTLYHSFLVWILIGTPISLIFLFIGIEPKNRKP